jgi:LPXTG-motif cell wall-anchored protein
LGGRGVALLAITTRFPPTASGRRVRHVFGAEEASSRGTFVKKNTWQKVLAVPATLSIGLGGALLAVAPAHAVVIDGTANTAEVAPTDVPTPAVTETPAPAETSAPTETPAPVESAAPTETPAPTETQAPVESNADDSAAEEPVVGLLPTPVVQTPTTGATLQGPKVTATGTGTAGNYVLVEAMTAEEFAALPKPTSRAAAPVDPDPYFGGSLVRADGTWTFSTKVLTSGDYILVAVEYSVDANGAITGASVPTSGTPVSVTVAAPAAPVVTAPTAGEVVRAKNVTISGTGKPGANVAVFVATPSYFDQYVAEQLALLEDPAAAPAAGARVQALAAEPEPSNPEDPIIVDAAGNWSVVLPLEIGAYRVGAVQAANDDTALGLSELSATVDFSVAAVLPAPVALPGTSPAGNGTLPETGSDAGIIGMGALLVLGGGALLFARRRMTASAE